MSQQINLFNPIFLKQKKIFTTSHMAQTLGLVAAGALLLAAYGAVKTSQLEKHAEAGKVALAAAEARLAQVGREFPPRQKSKALEAEVVRVQGELKSLREVQSVLQRGELGNTAGYSEYFRAFARETIPGVWLTNVNVVGAGKEVGLEGRALQPELLPGYIQKLTREAVLQGKTFGSLEISRPGAVARAGTAAAGGAETPSTPYVEFRLAAQPAQAKEAAK
ncbi:hypothetical protein [Pseudoduganella violaceinigra]|uniref:hypothetical protein n=1 Tax=Pseudoduganella violaceinigra TaxID=246602 RepID=UPI00040253EE|nr:hypothetical protein [Pseudoduganella violaceinigra]